ncbi:MAG: CCA tRNA nucleotidyltransferase [Nitrospira sp.]|nr:CCA tRNA nucleotidyltransferase [Nitrospira sp.]
MKKIQLPIDDERLTKALQVVMELVQDAGGRVFLVGGSVRDLVGGHPPKDLDLEVYGLQPQHLIALLSGSFEVDLVGQSFGIIKLQGLPIDVAIPCRRSQVGERAQGFAIDSDPFLAYQEAAARRDFTMNAMSIDLATMELFDPYHGAADLERGILRHTSLHFADDPLRVLRGFQLVSRLQLTPHPSTVNLCQELYPHYQTLPLERIWGEWYKWATKSVQPSLGLLFLKACGWREAYPELNALEGCPQDSRWHPEGDVWTHTLLVTDEAAKIAERDKLSESNRGLLVLSALCHDLGKPETTVSEGDRIRSHGHANTLDTFERFLTRLGTPAALRRQVITLCQHHLTHCDFEGSTRHIRRLAAQLGSGNTDITMLSRLIEADHSGRPPLPKGLPDRMSRMMAIADNLLVMDSAPRPILLGRHLLELGLHPGPYIGEILRAAYEAQLDGQFETLDCAEDWFRTRYNLQQRQPP